MTQWEILIDVRHAYKKDGKAALMIAAEIGNSYTVMELLNEGAKINLKDTQGNNALMLAIEPLAKLFSKWQSKITWLLLIFIKKS